LQTAKNKKRNLENCKAEGNRKIRDESPSEVGFLGSARLCFSSLQFHFLKIQNSCIFQSIIDNWNLVIRKNIA
jgi:hypothetical protein